jgi:hypothetical protein
LFIKKGKDNKNNAENQYDFQHEIPYRRVSTKKLGLSAFATALNQAL